MLPGREHRGVVRDEDFFVQCLVRRRVAEFSGIEAARSSNDDSQPHRYNVVGEDEEKAEESLLLKDAMDVLLARCKWTCVPSVVRPVSLLLLCGHGNGLPTAASQ